MSRIVLFILFHVCFTVLTFSQSLPESFINPTGTYILKGSRHKGEIKGHYGEIRVKLLDSAFIAMTFYCNKGYPEYKPGTFLDTMQYAGTKAIYLPKSDASCKLIFEFDSGGLNIKQAYTDPQSTCGFGSGIVPLGFIPKHSAHVPIIQNLYRPEK